MAKKKIIKKIVKKIVKDDNVIQDAKSGDIGVQVAKITE